jgi:hypothetical protein
MSTASLARVKLGGARFRVALENIPHSSFLDHAKRGGSQPFGQTQFSALIPGMRPNSRKLLVTTINPSLRA